MNQSFTTVLKKDGRHTELIIGQFQHSNQLIFVRIYVSNVASKDS